MKKGQNVNVYFNRFIKPGVAEGFTLNNPEGPVKVKAKNAYPGLLAEVRLRKKRKGIFQGDLTKQYKREYKNQPVCYLENRCGGCLYQDVTVDENALKENYLRELFKDYNFLGLKEAEDKRHYRNKMEYSFGDEVKDGELNLGLHQRGSFYNIVNTDGCILVSEDFETIRKAVLNFFRDKGTSFYHKNTHSGFLRFLVLREGFNTGEIMVNLVTTSEEELDKEAFVKMLKDLDLSAKITGILQTISNSPADAVIPEETFILDGKDTITEKLLDKTFLITPFSFFQVNTKTTEKLYEIVKEFLKDAFNRKPIKTLYDLYSGTGTIGIILSDVAEEVISIELIEEATEIAKENAKLNNVNNITFIAGDVLEEAENLDEKPDAIILDPPRSGINPKAIKKIIALDPKVFIYVSCNPVTLKEDLKTFEENGYEIVQMKGVNMFPQTSHIETVVELKKKDF